MTVLYTHNARPLFPPRGRRPLTRSEQSSKTLVSVLLMQ